MKMRWILLLLMLFVSGGLLEAQRAALENPYERVSSDEAGLSVVIDQPSPIVGCGQPVTLTATVVGATEISWLRNGQYIDGATTNTFIANQAGEYSVVAVSLACQVESAPVEVILESPLNAAIVAVNGSEVCSGSIAILQAVGGEAQWQWYLDGASIADGTGEFFEATLAGVYTVVGNELSACASESEPMEVTILPLPDAQLIWTDVPSICSGDSLSIIASLEPDEEIVWYYQSTPLASAEQLFQATQAGEYYAIVTNASSGCSSVTNSLFLEVAGVQEVVVSAIGETAFCDGLSASIAIVAGQGSVEWFNGEQPVPGAFNEVLNVSEAGFYTAHVLGANGCVSVSNPVFIEVYPLPNSALEWVGTPVLCGADDTLSVAVEGGQAYAWYFNDVELEGEIYSSLDVVEPGEYAVLITNALGCSVISQPLMLEQVPLPSVMLEPSGNINVCAGQVQLLEAISPDDVQYAWYYNGDLLEEEMNLALEAMQAGEYSVVITDANGCSVVSSTTSIAMLTVNTPVILDGGITSEGQLLLTDEASGHQWYLNGDFIAGATGSSYLATEDGIYTVISIEDVCESTVSEGFEVVLGAVDSEMPQNLFVFPNPSSERVEVVFGASQPMQLSIYNAAGQFVYSKRAANAREIIDVHQWGAGIYTLVTDRGDRIQFTVIR